MAEEAKPEIPTTEPAKAEEEPPKADAEQEPTAGASNSPAEGAEEEGEELEEVVEGVPFQEGMDLMKVNDYEGAGQCFARELEFRVEKYGELTPECGPSYYHYALALLRNIEENVDVFGWGEEQNEDLEIIWEMLECARVVYEKMGSASEEQLADVYSALGSLGLQKETFAEAVSHFDVCLQSRRRRLSPDDRSIAEIHMLTALAHQYNGDLAQARDHHRHALAVFDARCERLGRLAATEEHGEEARQKACSELDECRAIQKDLNEKIAELDAEATDKTKVEEEKQKASSAAVEVVEESTGFDAPSAAAQQLPVSNFGVVKGKGKGREGASINPAAKENEPRVQSVQVKRVTPAPLVDRPVPVSQPAASNAANSAEQPTKRIRLTPAEGPASAPTQ